MTDDDSIGDKFEADLNVATQACLAFGDPVPIASAEAMSLDQDDPGQEWVLLEGSVEQLHAALSEAFDLSHPLGPADQEDQLVGYYKNNRRVGLFATNQLGLYYVEAI